MNQDFEFLKKKYSENFAKLCRSLFPTLMEEEGLLLKIITEHFAESKFLYDDIVKNNLEDKFKNFIYGFIKKEKIEETVNVVTKSPFELMKKAGYTLYKCETNEEVQAFKKYWKKSEELCTFRDKERVNKNLVFFAVKNNASDIKRKDFKNPLRQDEYGTSVIGIQFTKTNPSTLSIKNRYNHSVYNPDATFSNDLDNIYAGLTASFVKEYNLNLVNKENSLEIPGYVLAQNGRFYKYNYEINNTYYCENNIIVDGHRQVVKLDKNKELLFDYFVIDFENKKVKKADESIDDSFVDGLKDIVKIQVQKLNNEKVIILTPNNGEDIIITLNNENKIIKYHNPNLTEVGDRFLSYNKTITELSLANLLNAGHSFLRYNETLIKLDLQNINKLNNQFLYFNKTLTTLNAPNLVKIGDACLYNNEALTELNLPSLEKVGAEFLGRNEKLSVFHAPNLKETSDRFLINNQALTKFNAPSLTIAGNWFMTSNQILKEFNAPNLTETGINFLYRNQNLTKLNLPSLEKTENGFLNYNIGLSTFNAPNLVEVGDSFLYCNSALTELNLPSLKIIKPRFLGFNHILTTLNAPNIESIEGRLLSSNKALTELYLPKVKEVNSYWLMSHPRQKELLDNINKQNSKENKGMEL